MCRRSWTTKGQPVWITACEDDKSERNPRNLEDAIRRKDESVGDDSQPPTDRQSAPAVRAQAEKFQGGGRAITTEGASRATHFFRR